MTRNEIISRIGGEYQTENIENGEYSYVKATGSKNALISAMGYTPGYFKLDLRFEKDDVVVLVETKQIAVDSDKTQLEEYLKAERAIYPGKKVIINK